MRQQRNPLEIALTPDNFKAIVDVGKATSEHLSLCEGEGDINNAEKHQFFE